MALLHRLNRKVAVRYNKWYKLAHKIHKFLGFLYCRKRIDELHLIKPIHNHAYQPIILLNSECGVKRELLFEASLESKL
jgi:hypothetical protein